ncbi:MAG TPA: rRNA maturation RNase YbeY [Thermoanaerobaculia bacterium]
MSDPAKPSASGAARGGCEIVLLNPNHYPEAGARRLRPWLAGLVAALAPRAASLGARFVGDREMRRVNRQFRGKDKATDVLSFPGEPEDHLGDLLISVPTARRQAAGAGHGVDRELKVLLLHGVLHCLGHDHEADRGEMERLERRLRRTWIDGGQGGEGRATGAEGMNA